MRNICGENWLSTQLKKTYTSQTQCFSSEMVMCLSKCYLHYYGNPPCEVQHVRKVHIHFSRATFSTKSILLLQDSQVKTYETLEAQGCYLSADI